MSACDNTKDGIHIKFHNSNWKSVDELKKKDRNKVKLLIENIDVNENLINEFNKKIEELRINKCNYLWYAFKDVFNTGHFMKRLNFRLQKIINWI
ncbi:hypothetical protein U5U50_02215 [Mycoplasma sp. 888]|uniref:hypothetical protein n=1 Tax=Mycoplasma sp. 888 TaxID=3108483 RepID=UPI002D79174A|nr:hypothetical protein [Mycoplasma sp. 888]WRQ25603.1 hypothetical protein U5U50_02215 [Mycoplasma sp. 888]